MNGQIYYHFLSSKNAIHDLERKMIRVSTLDTFNDPFELMPYLRFTKGEKIKRYLKVREQIAEIYGFLCFSKTWEEPLLWSHYADKHKGIALGFEINNLNIFDVIYDSNPIRKQFELTNDVNTNKNLFLDLAKIKYKNWEYEKESRILLKLNDCIRIDGHNFIGFGNGLKLKEVRLGSDYDYKITNDEYLFQISRINSDVEIIPSRLERKGYKINRDGQKAKQFEDMLKQSKLTS